MRGRTRGGGRRTQLVRGKRNVINYINMTHRVHGMCIWMNDEVCVLGPQDGYRCVGFVGRSACCVSYCDYFEMLEKAQRRI